MVGGEMGVRADRAFIMGSSERPILEGYLDCYLCSTIAIIDPNSIRENFTMSNAKHTPKRRSAGKAVPVLGAAGLLSLGGWRLGRNKRGAGSGPADAKDGAESSNHPRRGGAFRRQPVDLFSLRQGER